MTLSRIGRITVLAVVVVGTAGLICQYPPCNLVKCEKINPPENCTGEVRMGGGYCGCCLACFTTIGEGDTCGNTDPVGSLYYPPTALCDKGLYCSLNTSTCEPIPGYNLG